jgi:hypothetical protein
VTPHPAAVGVAAVAGETQLIPAGATSVRLGITLPDGWSKTGEARFVKSDDGGRPAVSIAAWHLEHVYTFPCRWSTRAFVDDALIGTAEGQAVALSSWWGQDPTMPPKSNAGIAPIASRPRPTTLQGYPAWSLQVLIPSGFDLAACDGGQLVLWDTAKGEVRSSLGPGELSRLWVVDVDGERIVIDAASIGASSADLAELQAVVDSVGFEP